MTASEITKSYAPESTAEPFFPSFTYDSLIRFHLERRRLDKDGNERPAQSLRNEESAIESWLDCLKLGPADLVGEELGIRFNECLADYLSALEGKGLVKQTVSDRKTIVSQLRKSFLELRKTGGLPEDFPGALKQLIKIVGTSTGQLARKIGIHHGTLYTWAEGIKTPNTNSLKYLRKLEKTLGVSPGVLSGRLPDAHWLKSNHRHCTTAWRSHLSKLSKLPYRIPGLVGVLKEEWSKLELFYTDPMWASERGFKTNSEWRIRWNNGRCVTSEIYQSLARGFYGYLCLPIDAPDKRVAGLGFSPEDLTLGLFSVSSLVIKHLHFLKGRSVSDTFNFGTVRVLQLGLMLTRDETGYLRQRPEFGAKLPQPVAESDWPTWCEDSHRALKEFLAKIKGKTNEGKRGQSHGKGKRSLIKMTHDPFEPVIDIIRERQHPISALFDLSSRLESLTPIFERGAAQPLACHVRSIFQIRLIGSNPLRGENFSMMTHIPQSHASFERACEIFRHRRKEKRVPDLSELYVETTGGSNIYQKKDGSWRLRFDERDFKNERGEDIERGIRNAAYDVPIVPSVWSSLIEYLFIYRPVLNEAIRDMLRKVRAKRGLPELTPEEELAIIRCPYVFRPTTKRIHLVSDERLMAGYGMDQMPVRALSTQILTLTSKYLPESKGFCAHACRHLVATEYIKNRPDGYVVAAEALHNTVEMVRRHYSWVEVGDLIKPWNDYHEDLHAKYHRGEL